MKREVNFFSLNSSLKKLRMETYSILFRKNSRIYFVRLKFSMPVQIAFSKRAIELAL